jgi:iron complex transport system permease protein
VVTTVARPARRPVRARWGRHALLLTAGVVLLAVSVLLSITVGGRATSLAEVWSVFTGRADAFLTAVVQSRYPRTALGVLAGAGLALAGTLLQGITRNPLADPGLLGVNMGAAAGVVTATAFLGLGGGATTVWWALPGAAVAGVLVYLLGTIGSRQSLVRLVLAGAVVSAVLSAYIQAVSLSRPEAFDNYRHWVVGSLAGRGTDILWAVLPFVLAGAALAVCLTPALNALALGDESGRSVGVNTLLVRSAGLLAAVLLSAGATAAVGPIAFVGLAVPHIVRGLAGVDFRAQLPFALVLGPVVLLLADVLGRVLVRPQELMVGVVTAFAGAPLLLWTVRRMRGDA